MVEGNGRRSKKGFVTGIVIKGIGRKRRNKK
jgi:hypothetical protein